MDADRIARIWHAAALALGGHPACVNRTDTTAVTAFFTVACLHEAAGGDCTDAAELAALYEAGCDAWLPQPWSFWHVPVFDPPHPTLGAAARLLSRVDPVLLSLRRRIAAARTLFGYPIIQRAGFLWEPSQAARTVADLVFGPLLRFDRPGEPLLLVPGGVPLYVARALGTGADALLVVEDTPDAALVARFLAGFHHDRVFRVGIGDPSAGIEPHGYGFPTGFSCAFAVVPDTDETDPATFVRKCLASVRPGGTAIFELGPWSWAPEEMAECAQCARVDSIIGVVRGASYVIAMRRHENGDSERTGTRVLVVDELPPDWLEGGSDPGRYATATPEAENARASFDIASRVLKEART